MLKNASHVDILDLLRSHGMVDSIDENDEQNKPPGDASNEEAEVEMKSKCFLLDDRGYLSAHPGFAETRMGGPLESSHINHR